MYISEREYSDLLWSLMEHNGKEVRLPVALVSVEEKDPGFIRVPRLALNRFGQDVPVIAVARSAFAGHENITDIILPSSVENIAAGAFSGCIQLRRITIPKKVKTIREGTFGGCGKLEDVYYEGTMEEWKSIDIVHDRHEIEFGDLVPGSPLQEIKAERLMHIPGNDALFKANIHFRCALPDGYDYSGFEISIEGRDVTGFFRTV